MLYVVLKKDCIMQIQPKLIEERERETEACDLSWQGGK